mmetsp:Transcript_25322/g.41666  ORF Transcript_25322/g.41666 Transcript_25322/m.41666 type:complete len:227 (+) Transcript_25322:2053-2733(+)
MTATRAGSTCAWNCFCSSGPKSVESCPMVLIEAHRTRGWGSVKCARTIPITGARFCSICLEHPSPICDIAINPACLYLQSELPRKVGIKVNAMGMIVLPPKAIANRSSASSPISQFVYSVSSSSEPVYHSWSSVISSIKLRATGRTFCTKDGTFLHIAGAFSARATRNSMPNCRILSSSSALDAMVSMAATVSLIFLRKKVALLSTTSTKSSRALRAASSSLLFKA